MIKLHFLYRAVIDILYPNICETCNKVTPNQNSPICYACIASMPKSNFKSISNNAIKEKLYDIPNLQYCVSIYKYQKGNKTQQLIYKLKYHSKDKIGIFFASVIAKKIMYHKIIFDYIVPVPMFKTKEKSKGYNQTKIIANRLSENINVPVLNILEKIEHTESQTKKSIYNRWKDQEKKFKLKKTIDLNQKHLLIVDDVITTGATMYNCLTAFNNIDVTLSIACVAYS